MDLAAPSPAALRNNLREKSSFHRHPNTLQRRSIFGA
jgi:hypothetical protein